MTSLLNEVFTLSSNVVDVTDATFPDVIRDNRVVILDVWAPWCMPCKAVAPILDQLSIEFPSVTIAKLNADESDSLAELRVRGVPAFIKYVDGVEVDRKSGSQSRPQLEAWITSDA